MVSLPAVVNRQWAKSFVKFEPNSFSFCGGVLVRVEAYRQYIEVLPKPPCFFFDNIGKAECNGWADMYAGSVYEADHKRFSREFGGAELLPVMVYEPVFADLIADDVLAFFTTEVFART